jgi:HEAT repeat protein
MGMGDPERMIQGLEQGPLSSRKDDAKALCQALRDRQKRDVAAGALVGMGAPALESVCQALRSEDAAVRACAARILGQIGDSCAVPPLCSALKDTEGSVRAQAIEALARIGDPEAVPWLIQMLKYPGPETLRAAAALGKMGDRRAILPLWEALLDGPAELDRPLSLALGEMARREPGPESLEVLQRLRRELRELGGESRPTLAALRQQLEAATAPIRDRPIPASAPSPPLASLPVPAAPASLIPENLPLPAAPPTAAPHGSPAPATCPSAPQDSAPVLATPVPAGSPPVAPGVTASEEILRSFQSVAREAARTWTGLRPVQVEDEIVFRRGKGSAYLWAAGPLGVPTLAWLAWAVTSSYSQPSAWSSWLPAAWLLPLLLLWIKLSSEVVRLSFKVDSTTREVVIYRRWQPGHAKRKRLPLEQIEYFLGCLCDTGDHAGSRLYATLRDGSLVALTDNLDTEGHVAVNVRILAVTCGKPAYFLDAHAKSDDLIASTTDGGFTLTNGAKLLEIAKQLYTPDEGEEGKVSRRKS